MPVGDKLLFALSDAFMSGALFDSSSGVDDCFVGQANFLKVVGSLGLRTVVEPVWEVGLSIHLTMIAARDNTTASLVDYSRGSPRTIRRRRAWSLAARGAHARTQP